MYFIWNERRERYEGPSGTDLVSLCMRNYMTRLKLCCTSHQARPITIDHIPLEVGPAASDVRRVGGSVIHPLRIKQTKVVVYH